LPILPKDLRSFFSKREEAPDLHLPPSDHTLPNPLHGVRFVLLVGLGVATIVLLFFFFQAFSVPNSGGLSGQIVLDGTRVSIANPRLTGFRKNNAPYEITAAQAFQDKRNMSTIDLKDLKAMISLDAANHVAIRANTGTYDMGKEALNLHGQVLFTENKTGNRLTLEDAHIRLKEGSLSSSGPVDFVSHTLSIQAQGLEVEGDGKSIAFKGPVRTLIHQAQFLPRSTTKGGNKK
jgi:lipopolysaccharide export system protein LptC